MDVLKETYFTLLPIVATALVGWVGILLKNQMTKEKSRDEETKRKEEEVSNIRKANSEGIKLVLRYMLNRYHTEYMIQGKITYGQYKNWMDLYRAYRALGGNSIAVDWNKDVEHLEKCNSIDGPSVFESMVKMSMDNMTK